MPRPIQEDTSTLPARTGGTTMSWSDLPPDLISAIAYWIAGQADLARFRSVCSSWRSASADNAAHCRIPLLLLPTDNNSGAARRVWILANDDIGEIPVPAARGLSFLFASPNGWTLGVGNDLAATLLHPWTDASASLPALPPLFGAYDRLILRNMLWDRSPDAIVISPGMGAFFCRLRPAVDGSWSPVAGCSLHEDRVTSITYYDGTFYLLDKRAHKVLAVDGATFTVVAAIDPPDVVMPNPWCIPESTLVVDASSTELHLIVRTLVVYDEMCYGSGRLFKAFRLDPRRPAAGWSEIAGDMGDRAVFVDHLRGFYMEANGVNGVRRNCVYVASSYDDDDYEWAGSDDLERFTVSVLDLDTHIIEHLEYGNLLNCWCGRSWPWPSWLMPNLH